MSQAGMPRYQNRYQKQDISQTEFEFIKYTGRNESVNVIKIAICCVSVKVDSWRPEASEARI